MIEDELRRIHSLIVSRVHLDGCCFVIFGLETLRG